MTCRGGPTSLWGDHEGSGGQGASLSTKHWTVELPLPSTVRAWELVLAAVSLPPSISISLFFPPFPFHPIIKRSSSSALLHSSNAMNPQIVNPAKGSGVLAKLWANPCWPLPTEALRTLTRCPGINPYFYLRHAAYDWHCFPTARKTSGSLCYTSGPLGLHCSEDGVRAAASGHQRECGLSDTVSLLLLGWRG